uniref:Reverse transcriptase domain-containing protein n=1 Tax=Trichuris muris TaxID=70415 RepID=A0A5S6QG97_TRIMR
MFIHRLPPNVQVVLTAVPTTDVEELAQSAHELVTSSGIMTAVVDGNASFQSIEKQQLRQEKVLRAAAGNYVTIVGALRHEQIEPVTSSIDLAAQTFHRFINEVTCGVDFCFAYVDDTLVVRRNSSEHDDLLEQLCRRLRKYGVKLNPAKRIFNIAAATRELADLWPEEAVKERTVQYWFKRFRSGDSGIEERRGGVNRSSLDNEVLKEAVEAQPSTTTRKLAEELGVSRATIGRHLKRIGKVKKLAKWIPHELSDAQKMARYDICSGLPLRNENDPFLKRIVTCDEKWCLYDNRKRTAVWLDKQARPETFPKPDPHAKKVMLSVWWCSNGVIHYNFTKPGESITADAYCRELEAALKKLSEMWPSLAYRKRPTLLHDNARPHVSLKTRQKLNELGVEVLPHPAYSPDLSPTDYHVFRALDAFLHQKVFTQQRDLENDIAGFFESRTREFYRIGINSLPERWRRCVLSNGEYFIE